MTMNQPHAGSRPTKPDGIPFSLALPDNAVNGTIVICPHVSDPATVAIELQLGGVRLGSAALTEEGALDLALRLLGTVMNRRRQQHDGLAAVPSAPRRRGRDQALRAECCSREADGRHGELKRL